MHAAFQCILFKHIGNCDKYCKVRWSNGKDARTGDTDLNLSRDNIFHNKRERERERERERVLYKFWDVYSSIKLKI